MRPGKSTNAKRQRARTKARQALAKGSPDYQAAVRSTGCVVPRLATKTKSPCAGRPEASHLEKPGHAERHPLRQVCHCTQHHQEYEGSAESWCRDYGLPFLVLVGEANRNAELFGHLV